MQLYTVVATATNLLVHIHVHVPNKYLCAWSFSYKTVEIATHIAQNFDRGNASSIQKRLTAEF